MDYESARRIGDRGERVVERELARLQPAHGFTVLHDVLLSRGPVTAQLDHVLVDAQGILVIETKVRTGAIIRGADWDKKWTAVYPRKSNKVFENPIIQNGQHRNLLRQVLSDSGIRLGQDEIGGLVVFVGADISSLELRSTAEREVVCPDRLAEFLDDRRSFHVRAPLSTDEQTLRARAVADADRRDDASVVQAHSAYRAGRQARYPSTSDAGQSMPNSASAGSLRDRLARIHPWQYALFAVIFGAIVGFVVWAVHAISTGAAPAWLWAVIFVMFALMGGESSTRSRRRRSGRARQEADLQPLPGCRERLALALLALVMGFVLIGFVLWQLNRWAGGGMWSALVDAPASQSTRSAESAPASGGVPSVSAAKEALKSSAPEIYAKLANPNTPVVGQRNGYPSYTWEYVTRVSGSSARVERITIMLDSEGRMVGVSSE